MHLFYPCAKVVQSIGMDVSTGEDGEEIFLRDRRQLPLDEVDPFALQGRGPICVAQEMTGKVLADHQFLEFNVKKNPAAKSQYK